MTVVNKYQYNYYFIDNDSFKYKKRCNYVSLSMIRIVLKDSFVLQNISKNVRIDFDISNVIETCKSKHDGINTWNIAVA